MSILRATGVILRITDSKALLMRFWILDFGFWIGEYLKRQSSANENHANVKQNSIHGGMI
jgi:hypothetical protein